jgi:hypothetical protein
MRSISNLLMVLFWGAILAVLANNANAGPEEKMMGHLQAVQVPKEISAGPPPIQESAMALDPFFLIREKGSKVWVERIIVTISLTMPKPAVKHDLNGPLFRKKVYDLLQSGESEDIIHTQTVAGLHRQLGMDADADVHLSRSILIVR